MRPFAVLTVSLVALGLAGCSSSDADRAERSLPIYLIGVDSNRLEVVERAVPVARTRTPHDTAVAAVEALMASDENGTTYSSLWGPLCGWGTGVKSIVSRPRSSPIVVTLTGQGAALCDLSVEAHNLRIQQLVWTVVKNLGVAESSVVRVEGPSAYVWVEGATPDAAYLAEDDA